MQERFKEFTVLITRLNRCIHKIKTEEMAEFNLKSPHVSCLYYLFKMQPLTANELCGICAEDKASISRSIEHLEKEGYLICSSGAKKRYNAPFTLTDKGENTGRMIADKIDAVLEGSSFGVSDQDRQIMYKSLGVILDNLQKYCMKYEEKGE